MSTETAKPAIVSEQQKIQLLRTLDFRRVPSVTAGGKKFFFVRFFNCDGRRIKAVLAWNRTLQSWTYFHETICDSI